MSDTPTVAEYLKFARLQMAAEAFIQDPGSNELNGSGPALERVLQQGNRHNSVFAPSDAQDFAIHWIAVDQARNTLSGFSGTLFKCVADDSMTGAKAGELVICFRSTEFIDDAARDNLATNTLEIKNTGFAWGQLLDMETWYASLKIPVGQTVSVTGYSLGGHLATAFNLMHPDKIRQVVTFNGAGVGKLKGTNQDLNSLVQEFKTLRSNPTEVESHFSDPNLASTYREIRQILGSWNAVDTAGKQQLLLLARSALSGYQLPSDPTDPSLPALTEQKGFIAKSLEEIETLMREAERVPKLSSGDGSSRPTEVAHADIAAESFDYRMAVQLIAQKSISASIPQGAAQALGPKAYLPPFGAANPMPNQFDIVGDTSPSMVAHSQWHIGRDVRVFIEDQPLYRGGVGAAVLGASLDYGDIKLLVDGYAQKDFGDPHSLVLLVDSLAVQNTILQLLPSDQRQGAAKSLNQVLRNASNLRKENGDLVGGSSQGKAEGNVLENVLNALGTMVAGTAFSPLCGNPEGNTWAKREDSGGYMGRASFYEGLTVIQRSKAYGALLGSVQLDAGPQDAESARSDFGSLLSLLAQAPFALKFGSEAPLAAQAANQEAYADWVADKALTPEQRAQGMANFSDAYLLARADYVNRVIYYNGKNARYDTSSGGTVPGDSEATFYDLASPDVVWMDHASGIKIQRGGLTGSTQYVAFGSAGPDVLHGRARDDRLFGGVGDDLLDGLAGNDYLEGNAGDDTLDGGLDNDVLLGGKGADKYQFAGAWGRDILRDVDARGSISLDGEVLAGGKASGLNTWRSKSASGTIITYTVVESAASSTGRQLLVRSEGSSGNVITIDNFDLSAAKGADGYLGIRLEAEMKVVVAEGAGTNFFASVDANPGALNGRGSDVTAGKTFTVHLNQAPKAGTIAANWQ